MSEHVTHLAVYEDTVRLIFHAGSFHKAITQSLKNHPDAGLMASGARANHLHAVPMLEYCKNRWGKEKQTHELEQWIAASVGWLIHRAIDLQVKPMFIKQADITDPRFSKDENQVYHDSVTFKKVFGAGKHPRLSPYVAFSEASFDYRMQSHPAAKLVHTEPVEHLLCQLVQRNMLSFHRFNTQAATPEAWLAEFPNHYQKLSEDLEAYIEAVQHPDPLKIETYIDKPNVYNEADEIIGIARALQQGEKPPVADLEKALSLAPSQSHYAQGLSRCFTNARAANNFFVGKIDKDALYDTVEIFHEPHRM